MEELLQTLNLEEKAVIVGHSQVSRTSFLGHFVHPIADPDELQFSSYFIVR